MSVRKSESSRTQRRGASIAAVAKCRELRLGRIGFLRPVAGDGEGGITRRFGERRLEGKTAGEIAGEAADEGVAGAGRIDGLNLDRGDASRALPRRQQRAACAKRHDDRFDSLLRQ